MHHETTTSQRLFIIYFFLVWSILRFLLPPHLNYSPPFALPCLMHPLVHHMCCQSYSIVSTSALLSFMNVNQYLRMSDLGELWSTKEKKNHPYSLVTGSTPEAPHHNDDKQTSRLSLLPAPSLLHCDANVPGSRLNRQGCPSLDSAGKWDFWTFSSPCPKN